MPLRLRDSIIVLAILIGAIKAPAARADEAVPPIEARTYEVSVLRRSLNNRVYLLDDLKDSKPVVGKLLLLKRDQEPIMAFRIVKAYPETHQFAAKRVRRYGNHKTIENGETFTGIEKVADLAYGGPTAQDAADIKELENGAALGDVPPPPQQGIPEPQPSAAPDKGPDTGPPAPGPKPDVVPYDPELDSGSSPPPAGAVDSDNSKSHPDSDEDEDDSHFGLTVDEVFPLDPNSHWLSGGMGLFRNRAPVSVGGFQLYAGGGVRYGLTLGRMIFLRRAHLQDSFVIEAGLFVYKILNYASTAAAGSTGDAFTVLPIMGTVRYNILAGENLSFFVYGGMMYNYVYQAQPAPGDTVSQPNLTSSIPAGGLGLMFRVGPNWDARFDVGFEAVTLGLALRF